MNRKTRALACTKTAEVCHVLSQSLWASPSEVLAHPHLALTNTSGDVGLVLSIGSHVAELLDQGLGLDQSTTLRLDSSTHLPSNSSSPPEIALPPHGWATHVRRSYITRTPDCQPLPQQICTRIYLGARLYLTA